MRLARWAFCRRLAAFALVLATCVAVRAQVRIETAEALLQPEGAPAVQAHVRLPHRWDKQFPGLGGLSVYEMKLPVQKDDRPLAVMLKRAGNQVQVLLDGRLLMQEGRLGDASVDATRAPILLRIPSQNDGRSHTLTVRATIQPDRWGGLGEVWVGGEAHIERMYQIQVVWRVYLAVALTFTMCTLGLLTLTIWFFQRDRVLALLGWTSLLGALIYISYLSAEPPIPWPWWGIVTKSVVIPHWMLLQLALMALAGIANPALERATRGMAAGGAATAVIAFTMRMPNLWTAVLVATLVPAAWALWFFAGILARSTDRTQRAAAFLYLLTWFSAVIDIFNVRIYGDGPGTLSVAPIGTVFLLCTMCWILIERHVRHLRRYDDLVASLDHQLRVRELQLESRMEELKEEHAKNAKLTERQRLMREMHDGVGAQLVALINIIDSRFGHAQVLRDHAQAAMDELRTIVDSFQPFGGDLLTALASFRYRLQPRLDAANIDLTWDVPEMTPELANIRDEAIHQILRILLEAFTNILKHARAAKVRAHLAISHRRLVVSIEDNGAGQTGTHEGGQGLRNMRARAEALGGRLCFSRSASGGVEVLLDVPVENLYEAREPVR